VEIFQFDRGEKIIQGYGSEGLVEGAALGLFEPEEPEP
jgi:hypothetical protein